MFGRGSLLEQLRIDAGDDATLFLDKELNARKSESYDVLKAPLNIFELLPITSEIPIWAQTMSYVQYDETGMAKVIADYASDLPRVDVLAKEFFSPIRSVGASYGYNVDEIRASKALNKSLDQRKATAAVNSHRRSYNAIGFYGDIASGIPGWLTNPNIPHAAAAASGTGGNPTLWRSKTTDQILDDMNGLVNGIKSLTNSVEKPDTIVLSEDRYSYISTKRLDGSTDNTTVLEMFLKGQKNIVNVYSANEITDAERTTALGNADPFVGEIMIAYRKDKSKINYEIPMLFTQYGPQERNLEFVVPCESKIGGVIIPYPLAISVLEHI